MFFLPLAAAVSPAATSVAPAKADAVLLAQAIVPSRDRTLVERTGQRFTITGGNQAGSNLFHGFEQFGLEAGQVANFVTVNGIENILGRVTGGNASLIDGLLQVSGSQANLFLLNPAGVVFGPNARLDLPASLTVTTGDRLFFGDNWLKVFGENDYSQLQGNPNGIGFSADVSGAIANYARLTLNPGQQLNLIGGRVHSPGSLSAGNVQVQAVPGAGRLSLGAGLTVDWQALAHASPERPSNFPPEMTREMLEQLATSIAPELKAGDVAVAAVQANQATLAAASDLRLESSELRTAGALQLAAGETLRIRDGVGNPFVAQAGGDLVIRGDRAIDILALSNPDTLIRSEGSLNLISDAPISGDAHFSAAGDLSFLTTTGLPGNFASLYDPIISSDTGNVSFGDYTGAALKVQAAGSISGGNITITQPDAPGAIPITDPDFTVLTTQPSLILRAGNSGTGPLSTLPLAAGGTTFNDSLPSPGLATITVGDIVTAVNNTSPSGGQAGRVELTAPGQITVSKIVTESIIDNFETAIAGDVSIQAGGSIQVLEIATSASSLLTDAFAGDVELLSTNGDVIVDNIRAIGTAPDLPSPQTGQGGAVILNAQGVVQVLDNSGSGESVVAIGSSQSGTITIAHGGGPNNVPFEVGNAATNGAAQPLIVNSYNVPLGSSFPLSNNFTLGPNGEVSIIGNNQAPTLSGSTILPGNTDTPIDFGLGDLGLALNDADGDTTTVVVSALGDGTLSRGGVSVVLGDAIAPSDLLTYEPSAGVSGTQPIVEFQGSDGVSVSTNSAQVQANLTAAATPAPSGPTLQPTTPPPAPTPPTPQPTPTPPAPTPPAPTPPPTPSPTPTPPAPPTPQPAPSPAVPSTLQPASPSPSSPSVNLPNGSATVTIEPVSPGLALPVAPTSISGNSSFLSPVGSPLTPAPAISEIVILRGVIPEAGLLLAPPVQSSPQTIASNNGRLLTLTGPSSLNVTPLEEPNLTEGRQSGVSTTGMDLGEEAWEESNEYELAGESFSDPDPGKINNGLTPAESGRGLSHSHAGGAYAAGGLGGDALVVEDRSSSGGSSGSGNGGGAQQGTTGSSETPSPANTFPIGSNPLGSNPSGPVGGSGPGPAEGSSAASGAIAVNPGGVTNPGGTTNPSGANAGGTNTGGSGSNSVTGPSNSTIGGSGTSSSPIASNTGSGAGGVSGSASTASSGSSGQTTVADGTSGTNSGGPAAAGTTGIPGNSASHASAPASTETHGAGSDRTSTATSPPNATTQNSRASTTQQSLRQTGEPARASETEPGTSEQQAGTEKTQPQQRGNHHPATEEFIQACVDQADAIRQEAALKTGEANQQASTYQNLIRCYEENLDLARTHQNYSLEIYALNNIGITHFITGDYLKALDAHEQQLQRAEAVSDKPQSAIALIGLGAAQAGLGEYDRAIAQYRQALQNLASGEVPQWRSLALRNLGNAFLAKNDYDNALRYQQESLQLSRQIEDRYGEMQSLANLGNSNTLSGKFDPAIAYYEASLSLSRQLNADLEEAQTLMGMGTTYSYKRDYQQAIAYNQQSLAQLRQLGNRLGEGIVLTNLGDAQLKLQQLQASEQTLRQGIAVWESLRAGLGNNDAYKISLFETQLTAYQNLQEVLVDQDKPAKALEIAERSRGRAFVELLARGKASAQNQSNAVVAPPNLAELKRIAQDQQATLVEYTIAQEQFVETPHGASPQYASEALPYRLLIWVLSPNGNVAVREVDLVTWQQEVKQSLPQLIATARRCMNDRSCARKATSNTRGFGFNSVAAETQAATVAQTSKSEPAAPFNASVPLAQLHQLLIEPIADLLPKDPEERVVFVPQDQLFLVPFPALRDRNGTYLVEQHTIQTTPAIQLLEATRQRRQALPSNPSQALVVGNPAPMPNHFSPLPFTEDEAATIAQQLSSQALIGASATEAQVKQQLAKADIIHLATHGTFDAANPLAGAIALAPSPGEDGMLTAQEILDLPLNAALVVLSACDTGRGRITGDGVVGLSRSFLGAGAASVMVSLWQVPDDATSLLMKSFYEQRGQGLDHAQALRQAMLTVKQDYDDPKSWSGFTLVGEAQ